MIDLEVLDASQSQNMPKSSSTDLRDDDHRSAGGDLRGGTHHALRGALLDPAGARAPPRPASTRELGAAAATPTTAPLHGAAATPTSTSSSASGMPYQINPTKSPVHAWNGTNGVDFPSVPAHDVLPAGSRVDSNPTPEATRLSSALRR